MDPVSAVGITSASAQFITFASQLIATTAEIYDSATDAYRDISHLDANYSQLQKICEDLHHASEKASKGQLTIKPHSTRVCISQHGLSFNAVGQGEDLDVLDCTNDVELAIGNAIPKLEKVYSLHAVVGDCEEDSKYVLTVMSSRLTRK
ncbi:hypothetical protein FZEAL_5424 [Fusarium zealandicum]|uniref:Fungal N-terminal domain-containing protein n=1 Tax=Fusarium zealandicum TaxID=1053134 RepID=A0A8H4XKL9_9HYPO|nr:hypothetical protein FZEAL_5424 [Fusarium zealandicum]